MRAWLRTWWPALKGLLAVVILIAIGRQFALALEVPQRGLRASLEDLWARLRHPGWLAWSGALYLAGLFFSTIFWVRLLRELGQQPRWLASTRAYYIGHMGKYLPGKAWALFLRAGLARGAGVHAGIAVMTSFYEVLTTMAGGTVLAAVLVWFLLPNTTTGFDWHILRRLMALHESGAELPDRRVLVAFALLLLAPIGVPIFPPVFNRIVGRLSLPFRSSDQPPPPIRLGSLVEGLLVTAVGWLLLGLSLWAAMQAAVDEPLAFSLAAWGRFTAYLALAYVAGFIILVVPSGLGVREYFLLLFLVPELGGALGRGTEEARAAAVLVVLLLRLVWTLAELVIVGVLYFLPGPTGAAWPLAPQQELPT